jgi:hypothetical protein
LQKLTTDGLVFVRAVGTVLVTVALPGSEDAPAVGFALELVLRTLVLAVLFV